MPNEPAKLKQENMRVKRKIADLECQLEKEALKFQKVSLKFDKETLKFEHHKFKLEKKIASLESEITDLKNNRPPTLTELMSQAGEQLRKAEQIRNANDGHFPDK